MMTRILAPALILISIGTAAAQQPGDKKPARETKQQRDARMAWWREARFGMFIHWGLYSIPAGEWKGKTNHAEWIRTTAQIPVEEYDKFVGQFNPVKFDADAWVKLAKDAGMKYIVITSKHHDGFCLWDSPSTDFDVMSTPFKRDILAELEAACRRAGDIRFCMYHSIMDWHHPDYLPRRDWEKGTRSAEGANFDRYVVHLKDQLRELVTGYNPGVLWFDGEWEETWTHAYGEPLYDYVRGLNPDIIINNRVDKGRGGMAGLTTGDHAGDFGTPEQEIPATGFPGVDWESCMTMNDNWGFNKADKNFKSTKDIIRMLVDVASKGGNLLLNVGPTAEGEIPPESIQRLAEVGHWMKKNSESIYGTQAGPFKSLPWGRCTQKPLPDGNTRLYLHVFDWPKDGGLTVPGLLNKLAKSPAEPAGGHAADISPELPTLGYAPIARGAGTVEIALEALADVQRDPFDTVVRLDIQGKPEVADPPTITAAHSIFVDSLSVSVWSNVERAELRYTLDGSSPSRRSPLATAPIQLTETTKIQIRAFRDRDPVSPVAEATFTKVEPRKADVPPDKVKELKPGLAYELFEGEWDKLPDFDQLKPAKTGTAATIDLSPRIGPERFGLRFRGYLTVPRDAVYTLHLTSDDGSRMYVGDQLLIDNDGLHGPVEKSGDVALAAGAHALTVTFFERTGGDELRLELTGPDGKREPISSAALFHKP